MKFLSIVALTLLTAVNAANVTFKVIAPDAQKSVQVNINGQMTALNAADADIPYFTGSADLAANGSYKYVVDGAAENFTRTLTSGSSTRNEFYNRPITYATNIPELPSILSNGSWTRASTNDSIWDSNYVPSIFITGDATEMNNLIENVPETTYRAKITFIDRDNIKTFENCTFGLHRPGRKNNDAKQSWVWALPEGQFYADRNWFKIRHQEEDPTQMREKLYADILRKMGAYGNEANMIRFFINKEGMGTFNMLDDVVKYSYISAMFFDGKPPKQMGGLYDGGSGASFNPTDGFDSFIPSVESPIQQDAIEPFGEAFSSVDFKDDKQVQAISQYFDYDQFLRFMVVEFLTGDWDGYWMEQTNDGAFINTADNNKLYYLGQDFDATFGVNLAYDKSFVDVPYTDFPTKFPKAFLINSLLQNPTVNATFRSYLTTTVQELFNNATLGPYVIARHNFLSSDLQWDRSIKQRSPGNIFGWDYEQTEENLFEAVSPPVSSSPGGAQWGLLEWIAAKEQAVRSNLKIAKSIAKLPPTAAQETTPVQVAVAEETTSSEPVSEETESATPAETEDTQEEPQQNDVEQNADFSAATIKNAAAVAPTSAAGKLVPQILSGFAVIGTAAVALL